MRQLHKKPSSQLKVRGFEHLVISAFSLCLLVVLVLLPLAPAFAEEGTAPEAVAEPQSNDSDTTSVLSPQDEVDTADMDTDLAEDVVVQETPAPEIVELPPEEDTLVIENPESTDDSFGTTLLEEEVIADESETETETSNEQPATSTEIIIEEPTPRDDVEISSTSTSSEEESTQEESVIDPVDDDEADTTDTSEDTVLEDDTEMATTTLPEDEVVSANVVTTDENRFSFAKGECASVGDEMFYCAKADVATTTITHTDRVFSAPDAEGDKEIYIEKDGVVAPVTNNAIDDDVPYYDALSNTIVWHRLIDGRYQIVSFDIESEEETQLTNDRYNNMAPSRYDKLTVWQGWVGNDWEIFILQDNELMMITDNTSHDIAPSVNGNHIIWQSFETGVWQMKVYDIRTKQISTIEDTDGGSVQNPRFVLVYDTKFESGDVETRGYDLVSGEVVSLGAVPASIPKEIPDPDQTGEKRALVSPQTQPKTKVDEGDADDDIASGGGDDFPENGFVDVIVPALESTSTDALPPTDVNSIEDVLVPSIVTESATSTAHIDDVIITPFVEPISAPDDAQPVIVSGS